MNLFKLQNPREIYNKKGIERYSDIPQPGSTVLYVLFLPTDRFDDKVKKEFLAQLISRGVNVIVCLFRKPRAAYLEVGEIYLENGQPLKTIAFMVNSKQLSNDVSTLSKAEKTSLDEGYDKAINQLRSELLVNTPSTTNSFYDIVRQQ